MANWSITNIELYGKNTKKAQEYMEKFIDKTEDNYKYLTPKIPVEKDKNSIAVQAGYSYAEVLFMKTNEDTLILVLTGRWNSPHDFIKDIAKKFALSGKYIDREPGSDFTYVIEFDNGEVIKDIEENFMSNLAFEYCDIDELIEDCQWIKYEENLNDEYIQEIIALFKEHGFDLLDQLDIKNK